MKTLRFDIFRRLYTRFLLEPDPARDEDEPDVSTQIVPTTDIDDLLSPWEIVTFSFVGAESGFVTAMTVPANRRFYIKKLDINRATGDRTIDQLRLRNEETTIIVRSPSFTAGQVFLSPDTWLGFGLENLDTLQVNFSGAGTTDGTWTCSALVRSQDI